MSAFAFVVMGAGIYLLHLQAGTGMSPLTSTLIAAATAIAISYAGHRYWTFRHRRRAPAGREGIVYFMLNSAGLAFQFVCLGFTAYVFGLHGRPFYDIAVVAGVGLSTLLRYWSCRTWVWRVQPT